MNQIKLLHAGIFISMLPLLSGCGSTETITAHQHNSSIEIDGNLGDWPTSDSNIQNADYFNYYTMQNSDNLYIYVDFKSPFYNQAVDNSGFILYINEDESNKKQRGIGFPTGTFNLLRDDLTSFRNLTRESDWLGNSQNQRRLEEMREENFEQIMIVERLEGSNDAQYGFVTFSQIEAQGIELAVADDRRYYGLEFKIPLDGSPPFELEKGKTFWLGFAIEPPEFTFRDDTNDQQYNRQSGYQGGLQSRGRTGDRGAQMRRQLGQYEEWFKIDVE